MSDVPPPGEPPAPEPATEPDGAAARSRWARIAIPVAGVVLVALAVVAWQLADDIAEADTIEDALEELAEEEQTAPSTVPVPDT